MKQLKFWSGRAPGNKNGQVYVAAYSRKHAVQMINLAFKSWITEYEVQKYFYASWGNSMEHAKVVVPSVFHAEEPFKKPNLIYKQSA